MKIKLKSNVVHAVEVGMSKHHAAGAVVEMDDKIATRLVSMGAAEAPEAAPETPAKKPAKEK